MLCFVVYMNLSSQITSQRKRIMLLMQENKELKAKIKTLLSASEPSNIKNIDIAELEEVELGDG
jgi:Tfp pilus assembly protein PilN